MEAPDIKRVLRFLALAATFAFSQIGCIPSNWHSPVDGDTTGDMTFEGKCGLFCEKAWDCQGWVILGDNLEACAAICVSAYPETAIDCAIAADTCNEFGSCITEEQPPDENDADEIDISDIDSTDATLETSTDLGSTDPCAVESLQADVERRCVSTVSYVGVSATFEECDAACPTLGLSWAEGCGGHCFCCEGGF